MAFLLFPFFASHETCAPFPLFFFSHVRVNAHLHTHKHTHIPEKKVNEQNPPKKPENHNNSKDVIRPGHTAPERGEKKTLALLPIPLFTIHPFFFLFLLFICKKKKSALFFFPFLFALFLLCHFIPSS